MDILTFLGIADIGCVGVEKRISDKFIFRNIENHLMTQHGVSMAQYYEEFKHSIKIVNLEITGRFSIHYPLQTPQTCPFQTNLCFKWTQPVLCWRSNGGCQASCSPRVCR